MGRFCAKLLRVAGAPEIVNKLSAPGIDILDDTPDSTRVFIDKQIDARGQGGEG